MGRCFAEDVIEQKVIINMKHVKIYFEHNNTPEGKFGIESAWAIPDGEFYKLDNILFYAPEYSLGDVVSVENRNGELFVTGLIKESGHSTVRIIFYNADDIIKTRKFLEDLGCESEISDIPTLLAVDIPTNVNYQIVKEALMQGEAMSKWGYEEACIAHPNA
ncbi:uncharacterized protein DUF4265 [Pseudobacter ginsenosidimutans]|uniref:Uncharacterized protein DUF4265 n=2 Tax=Pseudobacter ginsenosidimutans TaxID=661488 RepID=A0A4Q7N1U9_9BACT|nr:uncharacterized protein DUF4265 [Pseudobacter ginsenosidimutans]